MCLCGALLLTAANIAPAQEALRNTLAYDQAVKSSQNAVVNLEPDRPHWGPVQMSLGLYSSFDLEDNVNNAETDPQADTILHAGVNAGLVWAATPLSTISLNAGVGYVHYFKNSQYNSVEFAPNSTLNWNVSIADVAVTLYDQFSFSQDVVTQAAISDQARFPIYDNTIGLRASWRPNQWEVSGGYGHDEYFSSSSTLQYLDRSSEYINVRGGWHFAEATQAGLEASGSLTRYRVAIQSGNTSLSVGPFAEWQITEAVQVTLRGGPTFYFFDSQGATGRGSTLNSYYAALQIGHHLTDYLFHQLSINRQVSLGLNQGGGNIEEFTSSYSASFALTQYVGLSANVSYDHGNQSFQNQTSNFPSSGLPQQTEIYDLYSVGSSVSWQAARKLSTGLSISHYLRQSSLAGRNYAANTLSMSINYAF